MIDTHKDTFICEVCDQHFHRHPVGGIVSEDAMPSPISICPECGPVDLEVMQFCREAIVGNFVN